MATYKNCITKRLAIYENIRRKNKLGKLTKCLVHSISLWFIAQEKGWFISEKGPPKGLVFEILLPMGCI